METGWIQDYHWEDPTFEGYINKKSGNAIGKKKWKERYVRIKNNSLFWFKNNTTKKVKGHINLDDCEIETNTERTPKVNNSFRLYSKKYNQSYYFSCEDYGEMLKWINYLKRSSESFIKTTDLTEESNLNNNNDREE